MKQLTTNQQLDTILGLIRDHSETGASIEEINALLPFSLERRTLQRRLDLLKEQGSLLVVGKTKSTRYIATKGNHRPKPREEKTQNADIPLSGNAARSLQTIELPMASRNPVSVNSFFLDGFRPNIDNYFTEEERKRLHTIGSTELFAHAPGTYAKAVMHHLVADLSYHSARLEGSAYAREEAFELFENEKFCEQCSNRDHQLMLNHQDAIGFIVNGAEELGYDKYTVRNLHAILCHNLVVDDAQLGRLRNFPVQVRESHYKPLAAAAQIESGLTMLLEKAAQITDPFEQAFFMMVQLPYLYPFGEMNLAVSRMMANLPLIKANLVPLSFEQMPEDLYQKGMLCVYELNLVDLLKNLFIWSYERSAEKYRNVKSRIGEPDPLKMKYREQLRAAVYEIVTGNMLHEDAINVVDMISGSMPEADRKSFHELVYQELGTLQEWNAARYWIRPSELVVWKSSWDTGLPQEGARPKVVRMLRFTEAVRSKDA